MPMRNCGSKNSSCHGMKNGLFNEFFVGYGDTTPTDTTSAGEQVIVIIGDSKAAGTSGGVGPTPTAGTVKEWNAATGLVQNVGSSDILGVAQNGSQWPRFGINYNADSGKIPVFVNCGSSGAEFSPNGDNNNWSTSGSLYTPAVTKINNCLTYLGLIKPKVIFVNLGINDASATAVSTLSTIQSDITSLITRLNSSFPNTDIVFNQIGRTTAALNNNRICTIRKYIRDAAFTYSNVHICTNEASFKKNGFYAVDNLHFSTTGNDWDGILKAQWMKYSSYSKWGRSILASMYTEPSSARKTLIDNFISAQVTNGNFAKLQMLQIYKTDDSKNIWTDYALLHGLDGTATAFTVNDNRRTSAGSNWYEEFIGGATVLVPSLDSLYVGVKISVRNTSSGVNAALFGYSDASLNNITLAQTTTPSLIYAVNDQTLTAVTTPDTAFQNDTAYGIIRSSSSQASLIKNGVIVHTKSVASTAIPTHSAGMYNGTKNQAGSLTTNIDANYVYKVIASGDVDYLALYNDFETLLDNW